MNDLMIGRLTLTKLSKNCDLYRRGDAIRIGPMVGKVIFRLGTYVVWKRR